MKNPTSQSILYLMALAAVIVIAGPEGASAQSAADYERRALEAKRAEDAERRALGAKRAEGTERAQPVVEQIIAPFNIVDVAADYRDLSTLVAAITAAGRGEMLAGEGPFTLFAPTNAAFAALPAGTLDNLLLPENKDQLSAILTYHVLQGPIMAADLPTAATDVYTFNGTTVSVVAGPEGATVNGAKITAADVAASNGVIHVIDTVLLPY